MICHTNLNCCFISRHLFPSRIRSTVWIVAIGTLTPFGQLKEILFNFFSNALLFRVPVSRHIRHAVGLVFLLTSQHWRGCVYTFRDTVEVVIGFRVFRFLSDENKLITFECYITGEFTTDLPCRFIIRGTHLYRLSRFEKNYLKK